MFSFTALDQSIMLHFGAYFFPPAYDEDDMALKAFIEQYTSPNQIIHVDEATLADKIVVLTGRPVDNGMWFEVGSEGAQKAIEYTRLHERPAVFVYLNKDLLPPDVTPFQIGRYWVAIRE